MDSDRLKKSAALLMNIMTSYDCALGFSNYMIKEKESLILYMQIIQYAATKGVMYPMFESIYLDLPDQKRRKESKKEKKARFGFLQSLVLNILYYVK